MYSAFRDLLSFTSIDDAIDKLFRIYLDTKLIELAEHLKKDRAETLETYWEEVLKFRRDSLDAYTLPVVGDQSGSKKDNLTEAAEKWNAKQAQFEVAQAYLYWFDLRASYWCENPPNQALLAIIKPPTDLGIIRAEADILLKRISSARAYRELLDSTNTRVPPRVAEVDEKPCARTIELLTIIGGGSRAAEAGKTRKKRAQGKNRSKKKGARTAPRRSVGR
jgi:hypothetical protein